jgi:hypothetical protein
MRDMLVWADKLLTAAGDPPIQIAQGGWRGSNAAAASGDTHAKDGGDARVRHLTTAQRVRLVRALKDAGFAAWFRPEIPGLWGPHVHFIPIGGVVSPAAFRQVAAFLAGRDGLRGNRIDRTYRPNVRWSYPKGRPVPR